MCLSISLMSIRLSVCPSIHILFPDDNLSKLQWIFTKLGVCIDIVEIWFGITTRVVQKVLSLTGFLGFIPGIF